MFNCLSLWFFLANCCVHANGATRTFHAESLQSLTPFIYEVLYTCLAFLTLVFFICCCSSTSLTPGVKVHSRTWSCMCVCFTDLWTETEWFAWLDWFLKILFVCCCGFFEFFFIFFAVVKCVLMCFLKKKTFFPLFIYFQRYQRVEVNPPDQWNWKEKTGDTGVATEM